MSDTPATWIPQRCPLCSATPPVTRWRYHQPTHDESGPAGFVVRWDCYGCGAGWDAIYSCSNVMLNRGLP